LYTLDEGRLEGKKKTPISSKEKNGLHKGGERANDFLALMEKGGIKKRGVEKEAIRPSLGEGNSGLVHLTTTTGILGSCYRVLRGEGGRGKGGRQKNSLSLKNERQKKIRIKKKCGS